MLCERSQIEKATYLKFHLCKVSRTGISIETENRLVVDRSWGQVEGKTVTTSNGYEFSFWG